MQGFDVEPLRQDIKSMLNKCEPTLEKEGLLDQAEKLEYCLDSYSRGISAAKELTQSGAAYLQEMRDHLIQRSQDLQRLESEGGAPSTPAQELEAAELNRAIDRIDHLIHCLEGHPPPYPVS
jgi:hypothetical protein